MDSPLNKMYTGLVAGLLVPLLSLLVFYLIYFHHLTPGEFLRNLVDRGKLSAVISLVVIPNLLVFFIFIWLNYLYSARGVLAATLIFALLVVITKFLI